jgi:chromate reductase
MRRSLPVCGPGGITDDGVVTNKETEEFLRTYMAEFHAFIERVYTVLPRNQT